MDKQAVQPKTVPQATPGYPAAVKAGPWLFSSMQTATDFQRGVASEAELNPDLPGTASAEARMEQQSRYIYTQFGEVLREAGASFQDLVRIWQWFVVPEPSEAWSSIRVGPYGFVAEEFLGKDRPATTGAGINELPNRGGVVAADWMALLPHDGLTKGAITDVPVPRSPANFPQAITFGDWIFLPGDTPTDRVGDFESPLAPQVRPPRMTWHGIDMGDEIGYTLRKQLTILEAVGATKDDVVKADIMLSGANDYYGVERAWRQFFPTNPPVRCVTPNCGLALRGAHSEIALVALKSGSKLRRHVIETGRAPRPLGHEPQAMLVGDLLFISSQMAADEHGLVASARVNPELPYYGSSAKRQTETIVANIAAICEAAGTSLENVVKRQAFFTDLREFAPSWEVWQASFNGVLPAECTIGLKAPLVVPGCTITMDVIAYAPQR